MGESFRFVVFCALKIYMDEYGFNNVTKINIFGEK